MVELLVSWVQKSNNDVFGLPIGGKTINNYRKNIVAPFNIQKSKVHVVVKHSTKTNCTWVTFFHLIVSSQLRRPKCKHVVAL